MKKPKLPDMKTEAPVAFLKEVDDALHAERMETLWREWKHAIVVFVVVLVASVGAIQLYKVWQADKRETFAAEWYTATKGEAPVIPDDMKDAPQPGLRALAAFGIAQEAMKANPPKVDVAAEQYAAIAEDRGAPQWLRDWASLNAALVEGGKDPAAAKATLDELVAKPGSPMYAPALELRAVQAQAEGDFVLARDLTTRLLALPDLPPQLSMRGRQRLGELSTVAN